MGLEIMYTTLEIDRLENFVSGHVCPDRHAHDNIKFTTQTFQSYSAIGTNVYIKCNRCHCWQDVTDYGSW